MRRRLSIGSYFQSTWAILVLLSYVLSVSGDIARTWVMGCSFLLSAWILYRTRKLGRKRLRSVTLILIAFSLLATADGVIYYRASEDVFFFVGGLLIGFFPLLLWRRHEIFYYWVSLLASSLIALAAVVGGASVQDYALYLIFLWFFVLNLNASNLYFLNVSGGGIQQTLPNKYFRQFTRSLGVGFISASLIFIFLPRTRSWTNPLGFRRPGGETGYSGTVSLDTNSISESGELAFVVKSTNPAWLKRVGKGLYFRGSTVDSFDGVRWTKQLNERWIYRRRVNLHYAKRHHPKTWLLKIFREPSQATAVFYPFLLNHISVPGRIVGTLYYDINGNLFRGTKSNIRYAYELGVSVPRKDNSMSNLAPSEWQSQHQWPSTETQDLSSLRKEDLDKYLQIPESIGGALYFKSWLNNFGLSKSTPLKLMAETLGTHFQENYQASLIHEFTKKSKFESFLTVERVGHCEYFATAAALFFRSFGVPARLVLGYRGGNFNPISETLEVREKNAHAWVEVFVPQSGWQLMDPTPQLPNFQTNSLWDRAQFYWSAATFWFHTYVVDYNSQTQRTLVSSLGRLGGGGGTTRRWQPKRVFWVSSVALVVAALTFYALRWVSRRRRKKLRKNLPSFYRIAEKLFRRRGLIRDHGETFALFHRRAIEHGLDPKVVNQIDLALERELYSKGALPLEEKKRLEKKLRELSRSSKVG